MARQIPGEIIKRSGKAEQYDSRKILNAIRKVFAATGVDIDEDRLSAIVERVEALILADTRPFNVEAVQDLVERALMEAGHYDQAKSYILYRDTRRKKREERQSLMAQFPEFEALGPVLLGIEEDFRDDAYDLGHLHRKFLSFYKEDVELEERMNLLVRSAIELIDPEAPQWEMVAGRLFNAYYLHQMDARMRSLGLNTHYEKISYLTQQGLCAEQMLQTYTADELNRAAQFMRPERDQLFPYSGLELLTKRYVIRDRGHKALETIQEMYLNIALFLAIPEKPEDRLYWTQRFYDMLSTLRVTMATPTLANSRKPYHQLSSCFIDTVPDDLQGIYRSISNFANVSKYGGGMGLYFGKVRSHGSDIRGFEGAAGGVIRWIRLANDTAVAVDQLGVRQGAVAVYLDVWHRDLPEFLQLRTNNGDDRMKAHDVFPAVCFPDYFWQQVEGNIGGDWHLFDPHEIETRKGYALEDSFGEEWTQKYLECVADSRISRRVIPIKDILRLIIKSAVETGTPFAFNRDHVNRMNPNPHKGIIYCSNLCTEIAQNMSAVESVDQRIETVNGETVVVTVTRPGDYVVCNLASLNLGKIDVNNAAELEEVITSSVRALDNVIELNFFPVPYAKINNHLYRPIGLGVSGYHHLLALNGIGWETDKHLTFADRVFEDINYHSIRASLAIAREKGRYEYFPGSDWETGAYFDKRGYDSERWQQLKDEVHRDGLRNGYLLAIAPTSSTSIIAGTTAGVDPIMSRFYYDEKKNGLIPRAAPDLSLDTWWYYKSAHLIDQQWSVRAGGVRQRHIDQAQSMNLYITNDYSFRQVLDLYLLAWREGVKTLYYIRSKSLEVEECESCAT
ncbi:MAG: ribonucleoside-diphosphate reductase subunit alpha [Clostridiales bacterium]|nr:ribonucleoside-diphosphate reductase subunit alpha [Clostridiales bacterium]